MILAAGRGERMRPLTDVVPKPLLTIHGKSLIEHHLDNLKNAGFNKIVINHAWLGHLIEETFGDGMSRGLQIQYSPEKEALETAGGIRQALPLLNPEDYFLVINGDVYSPDFPFEKITELVKNLKVKPGAQAYLFLVSNPPHHPQGDFYLNMDGSIHHESDHKENSVNGKYTFSGAGLYHKDLFAQLTPGAKAPLAPLLKEWMNENRVFGERLNCAWHDVGTPERLNELNQTK